MTPEIENRIQRIKSAFEQVAQSLAQERMKNAELHALYEESLESNKVLMNELNTTKIEVSNLNQQNQELTETIRQQATHLNEEKDAAIDEMVREIEDCIRHLKK